MKFQYVLVATMLLMLTSCVNKEVLPSNPKDKQEYTDKNGNHWVYNYAMMRWMMTPMGGGPAYYYYPSSNRWTNHSGTTVSQPSTVKSISTSHPTNTGHSFGSSHPSSAGS